MDEAVKKDGMMPQKWRGGEGWGRGEGGQGRKGGEFGTAGHYCTWLH